MELDSELEDSELSEEEVDEEEEEFLVLLRRFSTATGSTSNVARTLVGLRRKNSPVERVRFPDCCSETAMF